MASTNKLLATFLLICACAAVAVQGCSQRCQVCDPYGPYWNGQGCGPASNKVFTKTLPTGSDSTACCDACAIDQCCLFWVYNPKTQACSGYADCQRTDNQPTVREWLGDWKTLPKTCKGYSPYPDAQIGAAGYFNVTAAKGKNYTVGANPQIKPANLTGAVNPKQTNNNINNKVDPTIPNKNAPLNNAKNF